MRETKQRNKADSRTMSQKEHGVRLLTFISDWKQIDPKPAVSKKNIWPNKPKDCDWDFSKALRPPPFTSRKWAEKAGHIPVSSSLEEETRQGGRVSAEQWTQVFLHEQGHGLCNDCPSLPIPHGEGLHLPISPSKEIGISGEGLHLSDTCVFRVGETIVSSDLLS